MASTYSPLKIELMATGEKNNTWGTITNTNLGTALEEAITGTADVTFASGNVTLTLIDDNASQTARNLRLNLIGTTAGARDLIVPAIEKLYFINNTCADTITVKNTTGTGIAVPAGKSMVVFNNATNVVDGITHLTSLTLASALPVASGGTGTTTSTGTGSVVLNNTPTLIAPLLGTPTSGVLTNATGLPISTGVSGLGTGVATFLGTPSSSNLAAAVTDETGSGALVFATSPTLVTPALGTPASGVMTNVTGLPISTGVSGLGTGVATFLATPSSSNLAAAVTDETGSGALVFATSPTLVTPALGTPASGVMTNVTGLPISTGVSGLGTGVATFLGTPSSANLAAAVTDETGSGALVFGTSPTITSASLVTPALGTPSSGTLTSCTGLPIGTGVSGLGTGVATFLGTPSSANLLAAVTDETGTGSLVFATSPTLVTPALGTPSSGTLTNATGLPISTGVSGLGTGVATFLGTPSSANLAAAVTDETGSGSLVFGTSPTITSASLVTPALGTPASGVMTNVTGLPLTTGVTGTLPVANGGTGITSFGAGVATFLGTPSSANLAAAVTDETGSGSLVFATSPTLVTPALGTPASGVLTNVTGLPLTTGVTGTLPVGNGGTGVTTSTGTGSVVLSTSPTLVTPALGTPSSATLTNATGLPISTGVSGLGTGVATFLGTPTSANLAAAVTDETGSGALVFATSPSLVTPTLGTPASATLTNATGLPLTTGVTGTLPVGNGGTGATTLTTNGVVYGNGTGAVGVTAVGATGQVLIGNTGAAPSWGAPPAAGVTSVSFGTTGLTPSTATGGVITVAGTLAVANGGTGITSFGTGVATFLGTPSSANLAAAVTDETGTGALVFANTPTLIAPLLGTPTSGVLTNATGLPISTGVSGLGTGVATFLATPTSANLAAAVTDETGSGALVFANTPTLVTPVLGAASATSLALAAGLVATPALTFTGDLNTGMWSPAADTIAWSTAGTEKMRITSTGLVAIGTTSTPRGDLDVTSGSDGTSVTKSIHLGYSTADFYGFRIANTNTAGSTYAGTFAIQRGTGAAWSSDLLVNDSGNVGIGTTSPGVKLDVAGNIRSSAAVIAASGAVGGYFGLTYSTANAASRSWAIYNDYIAYGDFSVLQSSTQAGAPDTTRLYINPTGNVGIGTTTPDVFGRFYTRSVGISSSGSSGIQLNSATGSGAYFDMGVNGSRTFSIYSDATDSQLSTQSAGILSLLVPGAGYIWFSTNGIERMRITSAGNVGIGTTSPGEKLDVAGNIKVQNGTGFTTANAIISNITSYAGSANQFQNASVDFLTGAFTDSGQLSFTIALSGVRSEAMRINTSGNVGIGTTSPNTMLHVTGLITIGTGTAMLTSSVAMNDGAAAAAGTLLNAPAAGNPTKWIPFNDNGTTRYIPAW